jgi:hypothetical protein
MAFRSFLGEPPLERCSPEVQKWQDKNLLQSFRLVEQFRPRFGERDIFGNILPAEIHRAYD